ncbi:MAG: hypothetical protein GX905_07670 [Bacteroidales bacterium]|nr:hypothetical protein [Bacteroidales bacterium]
MTKLYKALILLIISFLPYKSIVAQTTGIKDSFPISIPDSTNTELFPLKGNLEKLCENLMFSYRLYHTGDTVYLKDVRKSLPLVLFFQKGKQVWHMAKEEFYKIPIDSIESIEAVYDPKRNAAYGGTLALECLIKVTLKENTKIE